MFVVFLVLFGGVISSLQPLFSVVYFVTYSFLCLLFDTRQTYKRKTTHQRYWLGGTH